MLTLTLYLGGAIVAPTVRVPIFMQVGAARAASASSCHPDDVRLELVGDLGRVVGRGDHVAAADVDLVGERERDRLAGDRLVEVAVEGDDPRDRAASCPDGSTRIASPGRTVPLDDRAGEAAEVEVRAVDPLHRHAERRRRARLVVDLDGLEVLEQRRPVVPGRVGARARRCCRPRSADSGMHVMSVEADLLGELAVLAPRSSSKTLAASSRRGPSC